MRAASVPLRRLSSHSPWQITLAIRIPTDGFCKSVDPGLKPQRANADDAVR